MKFLTFLYLNIFTLSVLISQSKPELDNFFNTPELQSAIIGISVKEVSSSKILFEKNSHLQLIPASTFKLLTTITALEKLSPQFQFKTEIYYSGNIQHDTLNGNLLIKGYGDPAIESRFFKNQNLQNIISILNKQNIKFISGKLVILNNYFQPEVNNNWTYEDINNYYAAIPYPINIYDNQFHLYLSSQKKLEPTQILTISPQYENYPKIQVTTNRVIAKEGGDNAYIYGDPLGYEKRIAGSIPPFQKEYSIEGALPDPARMFAEKLIQELNKNNIRISNNHYSVYNDTFDISNAKLLHTLYSPPLSEIIKLTNLHSINLFAEALVYALGNGDYNKGKKEIMNFVSKSGISPYEINIDDGCGLSRLNTISAHVLTELLVKTYHSKYYPVFLQSLPVCGESGTMKNFSDLPPLKSNLKCKTGYFQKVRSFAGYMKTKSDKTIAVCIIYNNFNISNEKIKQTSRIFFETLYNIL